MSRGFDIVCGTLKHRINKEDKCAMVLIVGEMGSGKSLAAVAMADKIDPTFHKHRTIVYTVAEFLEAIDNSKKGQCIIFDEVGVGIPAREWQSLSNKMMSIITQILRFKNCCVIFTTPNIRFVDINVRESMNMMIRPKKIMKEEAVNVCKLFNLYTTDYGEVKYGKFIFFDGTNASGEWIDHMNVHKPSEELVTFYEKLSHKMKNDKIRELRENMDEGLPPHHMEVAALNNKAESCIRLIKYFKQNHTWNEMATASGMSKRILLDWMKEASVDGVETQ